MIPLHITCQDIRLTENLRTTLRKHVDKLETFYSRIQRCDVVISSPHRHHRKGKIFHIRVQLHIPGNDVHVNREPEKDGAHEDLFVALRDTFQAVERQLATHVQKWRSSSKRDYDVAATQVAYEGIAIGRD